MLMNLWAAIANETDNIGDDIQAVAAREFLPRVDLDLYRDRLSDAVRPECRISCILNGWFLWGGKWPPAPNVNPLVTSFHISSGNGAFKVMERDGSLKWLEKHGPIGCRSHRTEEFLRKRGIDCYFSGCLTLTLAKPAVESSGSIVWVDVPLPAWGYWRPDVNAKIVEVSTSTTHYCRASAPVAAKMEIARHLLELYAGAHLVVTHRLHAALPCVAFGIPVLYVLPESESDRVEPFLDLMSGCISKEQLKRGDFDFDWANPPKPVKPTAIIQGLNDRVRSWVAQQE